MRILLITLFFPPKYNAGTENYTFELAKTLILLGHDVHVMCADQWDEGERYLNEVTMDLYQGIPMHRLHLNWVQAKDPNQVLYYSKQVEKWLDHFLKEEIFDLVHVTSAITLGVGILRSVRRAGIPLALTLMDFWFLCPSIQLIRSDGTLCDGKTSTWDCQQCLMAGSKLFNKIPSLSTSESLNSGLWDIISRIRLISKARGLRGMLLNISERKHLLSDSLKLPDRLITHSRTVQKIFEQNKISNITVIKNGQDLSWANSEFVKSQDSTIRIGYIGQIHWIKGVHILVEAFKKSSFKKDVHLDIWGDLSRNGPYTKKLMADVEGISTINLCGRFDHDQLAKILAGITVIVVPSLWYENAPLVIKEAFAAKIPVIATNLGGMAEYVTDEVDGLLFERGNSDALRSKLQRIVEEPGLLEKLQQGIQPVKTMLEEAIEIEKVYNSMVFKN
jgi:glycosyltransferase involved in cell wall biosynthesis